MAGSLTRRRILALGAAACLGGGGIYTFGIEPVWLRKVELDVRLRGLDPAFDGFTIAQLSDLHVGAGVPLDYLHVAGLGDLWLGDFRPGAVPLQDPGGPTIALSHNPDTAHDLAGHGADLILSGHTHGGQVSIPFLGPPILPVRHREFAAGHFDIGRTQLYVNRGVGWLRRVRLFVRPEVTVLRLRPA